MTPHIPEEWSPFVIMGNAMPPRDPEEDEEDGDEEEEEEAMRTRRMRRSRWTRAAVLPQGYDRASVPAAQDN